MSKYTLINYVSVNPRRLVYFSVLDGYSRYKHKYVGSEVRKNSTGYSQSSLSRIKDIVSNLSYVSTNKFVYSIKDETYFYFKLGFVTLTLSAPQFHHDNFIISNMLRRFLDTYQKRNRGLLYIWVSEVQDNGNIHFHITWNIFAHHKQIRDTWNKIQSKFGYTSKGSNPNSTDVKCVVNVDNISSYISSYIAKKDIYTNVLKRYFRRFSNQLKSLASSSFTLPTNYFKHLKRKHKKAWNCSKSLKVKVVCDLSTNEPDIPNIYVKSFDYFTYVGLKKNQLNHFKPYSRALRKAMSEAIELNNLVPKSYTIENLNN